MLFAFALLCNASTHFVIRRDGPLSNVAFRFNLRHYSGGGGEVGGGGSGGRGRRRHVVLYLRDRTRRLIGARDVAAALRVNLGEDKWAVSIVTHADGRGLHSSTFQLNMSALYGIGGARRGCVAHVEGVLGGV